LRLLKVIFREVEAFDYKCEAFIKVSRLYKVIFREIKALIRNMKLLQRLRDFLKIFSMELRLF
jgi:hypothetical protein